jgi:hypothetical protein
MKKKDKPTSPRPPSPPPMYPDKKAVIEDYGNGYGTVITKEGHELWSALINCEHNVVSGPGGGVKCTKCRGWFCY